MNKNRVIQGSIRAILLPIFIVILLVTSIGSFTVKPLYAASFTVNHFDDILWHGCGPLHCTLREAIIMANDNPGVDTIYLQAGTYTLSQMGIGENAALTGDLDITEDLIIEGDDWLSTTIDGNDIDRVFHIHPGSTVQISNVTIQNGDAGLANGGAILTEDNTETTLNQIQLLHNEARDGGGVYNRGTLIIQNSVLNENEARDAGGGIQNNQDSLLTITDSTLHRNTAVNSGGGIRANGTILISNSTLSGNMADIGGGVRSLRNSNMTVQESTFVRNSARLGGGMVAIGNVNVAGSTFLVNQSRFGGGIYAYRATLQISNSTLSGNIAERNGGGLLSHSSETTITNVTMTVNAAQTGGGIRSAASGSVEIVSSIIAANSQGNDCSGTTIVSNGHNLDSDGTCLFAPASGDLAAQNPYLGALTNNGGPTETHALLASSPAIDAGDAAVCADLPISNLDQRGLARPTDGDNDGTAVCDIGAYEYEWPPAPIGTNLGIFNELSTEYPLVDAFKTTRSWVPTCRQTAQHLCNGIFFIWDTGEADLIDLDTDGWLVSLPTPEDNVQFNSVATLVLLGDAALQNNSGQYIVLYEGEGEIIYGNDAQIDAAHSVHGRDVVDVDDAGNMRLEITQTDPNGTGDYIHNIRVIRPEYDETYLSQPFNPAFLEKAAHFSVFRFMDWMRTNDSESGAWSDRALESNASYATGSGVPLELMLQLANQTDTAPWFNMPHQFSDAYVTAFATLVRDNLDNDLPVYVEYSNETWNGIFPQALHVREQGFQQFDGADPTSELFALCNSQGDAYCRRVAGNNFHGMRIAQICDLWKGAWGAQSDRVVCVAASQASGLLTTSQVLSCPLWPEGDLCVTHGIDALAIAPYFGNYLGWEVFENQVAALTLDQLFTEIFEGGVLTPAGNPPLINLGWRTLAGLAKDKRYQIPVRK